MVALGRVVFTTREHVIAIEPRGKGMLGVTLRYIVETKAGHLQPERFTDHYEDALKELIKKKQRGEKIERPKKHPQAQVINLMEALRQSAAAERGGACSHARRTPTRTPANRPSTRPRKAG
jgi:DNA end-binding protein Ku